MEGFLVLMPAGQKADPGETDGPRILLEWNEKDGVWRGKVRSPLEWRGTKVGSFSFGIEVAEI
jgi:hypothetical protein